MPTAAAGVAAALAPPLLLLLAMCDVKRGGCMVSCTPPAAGATWAAAVAAPCCGAMGSRGTSGLLATLLSSCSKPPPPVPTRPAASTAGADAATAAAAETTRLPPMPLVLQPVPSGGSAASRAPPAVPAPAAGCGPGCLLPALLGCCSWFRNPGRMPFMAAPTLSPSPPPPSAAGSPAGMSSPAAGSGVSTRAASTPARPPAVATPPLLPPAERSAWPLCSCWRWASCCASAMLVLLRRQGARGCSGSRRLSCSTCVSSRCSGDAVAGLSMLPALGHRSLLAPPAPPPPAAAAAEEEGRRALLLVKALADGCRCVRGLSPRPDPCSVSDRLCWSLLPTSPPPTAASEGHPCSPSARALRGACCLLSPLLGYSWASLLLALPGLLAAAAVASSACDSAVAAASRCSSVRPHLRRVLAARSAPPAPADAAGGCPGLLASAPVLMPTPLRACTERPVGRRHAAAGAELVSTPGAAAPPVSLLPASPKLHPAWSPSLQLLPRWKPGSERLPDLLRKRCDHGPIKPCRCCPSPVSSLLVPG